MAQASESANDLEETDGVENILKDEIDASDSPSSNDELEIYSAPYHEIAAIDFEPSNSWMEESTVTITLTDGSWFEFAISADSNGDKKFYDKLVETWERNKQQ
jgi:hypothetical protein